MTVARRFAVVAALVVATTAAVALPSGGSAAAAAVPCAGVLVVIDHGALGGGTEQDCVAVHANAADDVTAAGHVLTGTQQFGAALVCRIDGEPADQPCVGAPPADAYWGLYWTNGTTGRWAYASLGAYSLSVPKGGAVAFAWQDSTTSTPPDIVAPKIAAHGPGVSPKPSAHPKPSVTPTPATSPSPKPTTSPSVRPRRPGHHRSAGHMAGHSTGSAGAPSPPGSPAAPGWSAPTDHPRLDHGTLTTTPSSNDSAYSSKLIITPGPAPVSPGGGLPGWVAPAIVIILAAGSGYAVRHRKRR